MEGMKKPKIENWVLTPHAVKRALERGVSIDEIAIIVSDPDLVLSQGPKFILAKTMNQRSDNLLACVLLEKKKPNLWVIVTVMHNFEERE
jgi:hypothetical protein